MGRLLCGEDDKKGGSKSEKTNKKTTSNWLKVTAIACIQERTASKVADITY